jgi:hypothetical protein
MVALALRNKTTYGNQNNQVKNQNSNSFLDFFDANPNKEGFQLFNSNPTNKNAQSAQTVIQTPTGVINPNQQGLLSNEEIVEQNTGGILSPSAPAKEGGYTYNFSQNNQRTSPYSVFTTPQNNTNANAGVNSNFVRPTLPASEGSYTHGYGLGTPTTDTNKDGTPKKKSFMDILKDFTQTDFALDMAMKGLEASAPKVGTPTSTGRTLFEAYNYAKEQKQQKIDNEINRQKAKTDNYKEPVFRGLIIDKKGNEYGYFSSGGSTYAEVNKKRVNLSDLKNAIGDFEIRNVGQQTIGVANFDSFATIEQDLLDSEKSLQSYQRYLDLQEDTNTGVARLANQYSAIFKTFFGQGLTPEELATKVANGELQRLIGASRKNIVGGGVMTEQDALRIIDALGGQIDSLQDPQAVKRAISQMFKETYKDYEVKLKQYNYNVDREYGNTGYERKKPIEFTKNQLENFSGDVIYDLGLVDFEAMSDEQILDIIPENLNDEELKIYFDVREVRGLI